MPAPILSACAAEMLVICLTPLNWHNHHPGRPIRCGECDIGYRRRINPKTAVIYDKDGDAHYDTISAFIKSVRGSDPDAALYWLAKMLAAGEDPRFILRRLIF